MYILLARPVPTPNGETLQSSCYRFKRACKWTANGALTAGSSQAQFILSEIKKLREFKSGSLVILLVSFAGITELDLTEDCVVSPSNGSYCLMGKIPIDFPYFLREKSPDISLGQRAQLMSTVSLDSCRMKLSCSDGEKCLSFSFRNSFKAVEVPITITVEELGASSSTDKQYQVVRPRTGEVLFNYRYYYNNKLHITQVTEDYTCPFCLLKCASYEGLECHLPASHDLFNYVFLGEGRYQVVIISAKITSSSAEIVGKLEPGEKVFKFCRMSTRRRKPERKNQNANHVALDSNMPGVVSERLDREATAADVSIAAADIVFSGPEEDSASVPGSSVTPTTLRKSARSRKSRKGHNARNQSLSERRQFVHSRTGQPMAPEQVFAEEEGEDEVDDEVLDLEDRMRLDRFKDEIKPMASARMFAKDNSEGNVVANFAKDNSEGVVDNVVVNVEDSSIAPPTLLQARNSESLLEGRQFFHSRTFQPMSSEYLFGDEDSEDEVDHEIPDLEDKIRLDRFKDVSQHEK